MNCCNLECALITMASEESLGIECRSRSVSNMNGGRCPCGGSSEQRRSPDATHIFQVNRDGGLGEREAIFRNSERLVIWKESIRMKKDILPLGIGKRRLRYLYASL